MDEEERVLRRKHAEEREKLIQRNKEELEMLDRLKQTSPARYFLYVYGYTLPMTVVYAVGIAWQEIRQYYYKKRAAHDEKKIFEGMIERNYNS